MACSLPGPSWGPPAPGPTRGGAEPLRPDGGDCRRLAPACRQEKLPWVGAGSPCWTGELLQAHLFGLGRDAGKPGAGAAFSANRGCGGWREVRAVQGFLSWCLGYRSRPRTHPPSLRPPGRKVQQGGPDTAQSQEVCLRSTLAPPARGRHTHPLWVSVEFVQTGVVTKPSRSSS